MVSDEEVIVEQIVERCYLICCSQWKKIERAYVSKVRDMVLVKTPTCSEIICGIASLAGCLLLLVYPTLVEC